MTTRGRRGLWRNERLGLAMIAASLAVIGVIVGLLLQHQRDADQAGASAQAASLTRLLSALPYEQLVPPGRSLEALQASQGEALAYAVVMDNVGATLQQVAMGGLEVPAPALPDSADALTGRNLTVSTGAGEQRSVVEFQAPLAARTGAGGFVRLGYFQPGKALKIDQIPFFASLALAIFLLTPAFYFLVRREIGPIRNITAEIEKIIAGGSFERIRLDATGTVSDLLERFNSFAEYAQDRLRELEAENGRLLTSAKLLGYQKQRMERVLEAIPDVVLVLDESGMVSFANGKLRGLFGVAPEDVVGRSPEDWCRDRKIVDFINRCEGKSVARKLAQVLEFAPEGSPDKTFALRAWPLLSTQGTAARSGTLLVIRDVTSESLAARSRGEFVAHLAHELKTPLNVLGMYAETLQTSESLKEAERVEAVNAISDEVQRLATLIDNLLNITRIEMGSLKLERQRVNLKDLLQDAFDHVSRAGRESELEFALEVPENLSAASLDKGLLRVALNNLLTNAIKYSNAGGTVTIGAEETADLIRIYVSDTGVGIKPEDRERIFERFFRADDEQVRSRSGHGLGLSLARDIVHLHHGALKVESEPGQGSRFSIELWKDTVMIQQAS
ncbi:MAG TPA: ATP-binding protein [Gammaproteobacteria bacterium]|nr:ATP-binding protein [Gammaproteobacteria bacterium]